MEAKVHKQCLFELLFVIYFSNEETAFLISCTIYCLNFFILTFFCHIIINELKYILFLKIFHKKISSEIKSDKCNDHGIHRSQIVFVIFVVIF